MKSAFSLIELSIVLVILGLLTGGILAGQNLIRAAELRSITTEFSQYQTAVNTFKDKYFTVPGDFARASEFWPGEVTSGDGDGRVGDAGSGNASEIREQLYFWDHLANSGLIEGSFGDSSGIAVWQVSGFGYSNVHTINYADEQEAKAFVPEARIENASWYTGYSDDIVLYADDTPAPEGHYFLLSKLQSVGAFDVPTPILSPEESWNIDKKLDDAVPDTGLVKVDTNDKGSSGYCADPGSYRLEVKSPQCSLLFSNAY